MIPYGNRKGDLAEGKVSKCPGGHLLSPWEIPLIFGRSRMAVDGNQKQHKESRTIQRMCVFFFVLLGELKGGQFSTAIANQ